MTKIEPMSVEEIKADVAPSFNLGDEVTLRYILAWIHAEARAREAEFRLEYHLDDSYALETDERHEQDWIAAVKAEVGWVADK